MSTIGSRILERRKMLNMTQEDLASRLGYKSKSSINKIELGNNDIPQSKIVLFADALSTTVAYLMGWDDDPSPKSETAELSDILADLPQSDLKRISDFMEVAGDLTDEQFEKVMAFVRFVKSDGGI